MSENVYRSPSSTLEHEQKEKAKSAHEVLMDVECAKDELASMWMVMLVVNCLALYSMGKELYIDFNFGTGYTVAYFVLFVFFLISSLATIVYWKARTQASLYILHIYAAFYVFAFPIGTAFSVFHFKKAYRASQKVPSA